MDPFPWEQLPEEIKLYVLSFLTQEEKCHRFARVSKSCYHLSQAASLWSSLSFVETPIAKHPQAWLSFLTRIGPAVKNLTLQCEWPYPFSIPLISLCQLKTLKVQSRFIFHCKTFSKIINQAPHLEDVSLHLRTGRLSVFMLKSMLCHPRLKCFELDHHLERYYLFTEDHLHVIVQQCPLLQTLNLCIASQNLNVSCLSSLHHLTCLRIHCNELETADNGVTSVSLNYLFTHSHFHLELLCLRNVCITSDDLQRATRVSTNIVITDCDFLTDEEFASNFIDIHFSKRVVLTPLLNSVKLNNAFITDDVLITLTSYLSAILSKLIIHVNSGPNIPLIIRSLTNLVSLHLDGPILSKESFEELALFPNLETLNLYNSFNKPVSPQDERILIFLSHPFRHKLKKLIISSYFFGNAVLLQISKTCLNVHVLHIHFCFSHNVTKDGIVDVIKRCSHLKTLSCTQMSTEICYHFNNLQEKENVLEEIRINE